MSFKVVGKGVFSKEVLENMLREWGFNNPFVLIREAEQKGRIQAGMHRIMLVR
jgi:hypothetical protein